MRDQAETLLEEENIISLRTAFVADDGNLVDFRLLPDWVGSAIPKKKNWAPKDFDWVSYDYAYLYRHKRSGAGEEDLAVDQHPHIEEGIKPLTFDKKPEFKLLWTDSGHSVALYLNGEPWAFIDEQTHTGYSKGILKRRSGLRAVGKLWDQELFENIFQPPDEGK
jgi:hypothetical protein